MNEVGKYLVMLIMCWNLENYFAPQRMGWKRFLKKRDDIAKTILTVHDAAGAYPSLIGVCEVENRFVLNQLSCETPLAKLDYKVIHKDSPDKRGIDVGLLYREEEFAPIAVRFIKIDSMQTRDILYVKGLVGIGINKAPPDTLHVFVNHWPSKLGGASKSLGRRMRVAGTLKRWTDSILMSNNMAALVIMGDFNDSPSSVPVRILCSDSLLANLADIQKVADSTTAAGMYDDAGLQKNYMRVKGSYKYRGRWESIDQFIVSRSMLSEGIYAQMELFSPEHLLVQDKNFLGDKINRTSVGPKYLGGVSDHLPILLKLLRVFE